MMKFLKAVLLTIRNGVRELYDIFAALCAFLGIIVLLGGMGQVHVISEPDGTYIIFCVERCEREKEYTPDTPEREKPQMPAQRV